MGVIPDTRLLLQDGAFAGWTVVVSDDPEFTAWSPGSPGHGIHILPADVDKLWMEVGAIETYGSDGKAIPGRWRESVFNDSVLNGRPSWLNLAKVRREQPEHQPREHPVLCRGGCGNQTWNVSARCPECTSKTAHDVPTLNPYADKAHGERQAGTRARSGEVNSDDSLVAFLYILMRDHLTPGVVEEIILNHVVGPLGPGERQFTNGWLASYAKDVAEQLRSPVDPAAAHRATDCPHARAGDCAFHRDAVHFLDFEEVLRDIVNPENS